VYVGGKRKLPKRRRTTFRNLALITCIPIAGMLVFFGWRWFRGARGARVSSPAVSSSVLPAKQTPVRTPAPHRETRVTPAGPKLVLILDDVGFDHQPLDTAMQIDPNLNFSVLPNAQRAEEFA